MHLYKYHAAGLLLAACIAVAIPQHSQCQPSTAVSTLGRIVSVPEVHVVRRQGALPLLPYRLLVTYADGREEWRTVRWDDADTAAVRATGYIVGDATTPQGFPVTATISTTDATSAANGLPSDVPAPAPLAQPIPLGDVHLVPSPDDHGALTRPNYLTEARDQSVAHLLALDVRQQLYNYRDTYGLPTDSFPQADGWDSPTTKLKGHGTGHYMSALALAYATARDENVRQQLLDRIVTVVTELRRCQEMTFVTDATLGRHREARDLAPEAELRELKGTWAAFDTYKGHPEQFGYGYIGAIPPQHCVLIEMYRPYNNEEWVWAPYYTVHKELAGLIDIATYVSDHPVGSIALRVATDMGLWVWNRMHYRTYVDASGTQAARRSRPGNRYEMWNMYIAGEVGGMAESLACLAAMNKPQGGRSKAAKESAEADTLTSHRLLEAARAFDSPAFFTPLSEGRDALRGRHANQHIPMVTGALRIFGESSIASYYRVASTFWHHIQNRYRYATGGVGNGEMFREPYTQMLAMDTNSSTDWRDGSRHREPTLNETCCAYNLARLTRILASYHPYDAAYMDYYERLLTNQLVGSLRHGEYGVTYQYAVGMDASKPWGNETPQSTCCGGTGAENPLRYQEAAYFASADTLYVALYLPTRAHYRQRGVTVVQETQWPSEHSRLRIESGKGRFSLKLRVPEWAGSDFSIRLNGKPIDAVYRPSSYVTIPKRLWRRGDVVDIVMPFHLHIDFAPDRLGDEATGTYWCGTLMSGPMAMCAEGISSWAEATFTRSTFHRWVEQAVVPDYAADAHITHYARIPADADYDTASRQPLDVLSAASRGAHATLTLASQRRADQTAWQQMEVKVPDYAPWAAHAYERMCLHMATLEQLLADADAALASADDSLAAHLLPPLAETTATLRSTLAAMRPGNLPEPEDLTELQALLHRAATVEHPSAELTEAVHYATMVVRYVSDGSGTHDMIARAVRQLEEKTLPPPSL